MFSNNNTPNMNNALNLFPTTSTPQKSQYKLQKLLHATSNRGPTQIQTTLAASLFDDAVEYMNTLEMNRAASYTFGYRNSYGQNGTTLNELGGGTHGESVADEMWELVVDLTLGRFTQHSMLALTKTICLIQHVLLHGSEVCVLNGALLYRIEMAVQPLRNLNTALVEQQMVEQILNNDGRASGIENDIVLTAEGIGAHLAQLGTKATATMLKLRGGSVDKGHPVRVAASQLYSIVNNPTNLRHLRLQQANNTNTTGQQSSLVPIGSTNQVGYITDSGRLRLLQQKMAAEEQLQKQLQYQEQQRLKQTRSNLAGKSATDGFGGGFSARDGNGRIVVGAAHSLGDMIQSARYELDLHKSKNSKEIRSLKKGYSDDPSARARQLAELKRQDDEIDPEFARQEKALQDALEYLEEMQQLEQEKVSGLLEGDLLGDAQVQASFQEELGAMAGGSSGGGGADLLGFDTNPGRAPTADVFGGAAPSSGMTNTMTTNYGGGGSADFFGFDGLSGGTSTAVPCGGAFPTQPMPTNQIMPGYMGGGNNNMQNTNNAATMGGGMMGTNNGFDMRPSLVTGMRSGDTANYANNNPTVAGGRPSTSSPHPSSTTLNFTGMENDVSTMGAMGGAPGTGAMGEVRGTLQPEWNEEAQEEKSRKMQMAAGLFAGVVPPNNVPKAANAQRKPIMAMGNNNSNISAWDDLIPVADTALSPPTSANNSSFNSAMRSSDPFGMGPMGGNSNTNSSTVIPPPAPAPPSMAPSPPSLSDPFGMGPIGGSSGNMTTAPPQMAPPPPPPMAPPPPPMEPPTPPPPPPPTMTPPTMAQPPNAATNNNNGLGANPSVEQMQEMIKQQQAQMSQMMQMMQQMQGGGSNNNNNGAAGGGWPPSS